MSVSKVGPNLHEIRLDLEGPRFTSFLSSWVYFDDSICFVVDTGPTSVIDSLEQTLNSLNVSKNDLDYVLLSHIHMDHAGGVGKLIKSFPRAQVICHPRGVKHLINPEQLWKGSLKVLGEVAKSYGKIVPVPKNRFIDSDNFKDIPIKVIDTQGHAPHHQSYLFNQYLFVGEAAGVTVPIPDNIYTRPATPPVFNYESSIASIQNLLKVNLEDRIICYAHFGLRKNAEFLLNLAQNQINLWVQVVKDLFEMKDQPTFFNQVVTKLKREDKYFATIDLLDDNMREKEFYFVGNSIRGITDYLQKKSGGQLKNQA
ncbi:MAG: MBL fold metallo-hydrolase [Candidatus Kariarchaeaceae archaeon]|jgi:glyoxylase-like metal-dependent hydrolase (beta-lactamase superfamily II)